MLTITIRNTKTTIIGQDDFTIREAEPIYEIKKGVYSLQLNAKEVEELKELLNKVNI